MENFTRELQSIKKENKNSRIEKIIDIQTIYNIGLMED